MYNPLVSIIIPVYNGANYLSQAIDSALAQTYDNVEIIVVNDGSTDNGATSGIAAKYADRIRYFEKPNGGCASALNFGISKMHGEWFSWLSHDDLYLPEKIESEINCVIQNKLDPKKTIVSCEAKIIDENSRVITHPHSKDVGFYNSEEFVERLLFGSALNGCGLLIPKEIIERIGEFSTELKYILDWDYWIRAALNNACLYRMGDSELTCNRIHKSQITVSESSVFRTETEKANNNLISLVTSCGSIKSVQNFYIYSVVKGVDSAVCEYRRYLKERNCFPLSLQLKAQFYSVKKRLRSLAASLYWRIVRKNKAE